MVANYEVTIDLSSLTYEIEADTEEEAMDFGKQLVYDETMYSIMKWADVTAKEIKE
jgi:hypothetical protein